MRAVTWHAARDVRVTDVPDPRILEPTDAIVRVTATAICGSDLHLIDVFGPFMHRGDVLGHEAMGIVEEVGAAVTRVRVGDRVVVPFVIACGRCRMCELGLTTQCETTQNTEHGTGASLYGYTELYGQVPGGQAEAIRVLLADANLRVVGADLPDERYLFLSDILPTAWQAVKYAGVEPGGTIGILGLGPVGQLSARAARLLGLRVLAVDPVVERRLMAERHGAEVHGLDDAAEALEWFRRGTEGRGPDAVVDAVGLEAHGNPVTALMQNVTGSMAGGVAKSAMKHLGVDRMAALDLATEAVRRGGTVSVAGVYAGAVDPVNLMRIFDKQLTMRFGQCNVQRWLDDLIGLAERPDDPLGLEDLVTHPAPLEQAAEMYELFKQKSSGCIKVVLKP
ncbi:alcohol dehydrogenase catalytic domain-containing protein [Agromyces sp. CFH 90414]|uniref:Alcohol dehydrogenase catalytic domain-containing protein n=1 Tax=Agromyces agglutinans TaxID=2662258 RepID=A0A6I2F7R4_9MICO|nr:alcohol dehydrogenase catalytic domain-containing protein [Agromyces agglutinans]MRG60649.1 alcohol dehydrogenase catalytic domain-containing protein [Agromyces agglutinans]